MSAKKRRRKAQLERLVKMDSNHHWLYVKTSRRHNAARSWRFWLGCIVALGDALERKKPGAWRALPRSPAGSDGLTLNCAKRRGIP